MPINIHLEKRNKIIMNSQLENSVFRKVDSQRKITLIGSQQLLWQSYLTLICTD